MKIPLKILAAFATVVFIVLCVSSIEQIRRESRVRALLDGHIEAVHASSQTRSREEDVAYYQGQLRLNFIGGRAGGVSHTTEVITFLDHHSRDLQVQALHLLGRFEDPQSLSALKEKAVQDPFPTIAKIALARVETRSLQGRVRLDAIADRIGLSWDDVLLLSQKINDPLRANHDGSQGDLIVGEMVDVLCSMANRGEKIESFITLVEMDSNNRKPSLKRPSLNTSLKPFLLLDSTQLARIQAAQLDEKNEIRFLLNHLGNVRGIRSSELHLIDYTVGLGSEVPRLIVEKLESISQHPQQYYGMEPYPRSPGFFRSKYGIDAIMAVCNLTLDTQVIEKLKKMQRSSDKVIRYNATESLTWMENRIAYIAPGRSNR